MLSPPTWTFIISTIYVGAIFIFSKLWAFFTTSFRLNCNFPFNNITCMLLDLVSRWTTFLLLETNMSSRIFPLSNRAVPIFTERTKFMLCTLAFFITRDRFGIYATPLSLPMWMFYHVTWSTSGLSRPTLTLWIPPPWRHNTVFVIAFWSREPWLAAAASLSAV